MPAAATLACSTTSGTTSGLARTFLNCMNLNLLLGIDDVRAKQKQLDLSWNVLDEVPVHLIGDAGRLQQCILNLVGNAIKFTHEGSVSLLAQLYEGEISEEQSAKGNKRTTFYNEKRISLGHRKEATLMEEISSPNLILDGCVDKCRSGRASFSETGKGSMAFRLRSLKEAGMHNTYHSKKVILLFSISDTGIGISEEKQEEVFKAFSQADSSTTRLYGGTGLGLSIVERLVGMMGGRIWLESELGRGSTFYFIACFDEDDPHSRTHENMDEIENMGEVYLGLSSHNVAIINTLVSSCDGLPNNGPGDGEGNGSRRNSLSTSQDSSKERMLEIMTINQDKHDSGGFAFSRAMLPVCVNGRVELNSEGLFRGLRVLLAEDNLVNQKVACKQLNKFGTQVDVVCDGQQCLAALSMNRDRYDLILMDVQMPVLDGLQATRIIRAEEKDLGFSKKPIIGLTAHAIQGYKDKCLEAGMDAYACKPFQMKQLMEVIQKVLEK